MGDGFPTTSARNSMHGAFAVLVACVVEAAAQCAIAATQDFTDPAVFARSTGSPITIGFNGILPSGTAYQSFNPLTVSGANFFTTTPGVFVNVTRANYYSPHVYSADMIVASANPAGQPGNNELTISFQPTHAVAVDLGGVGANGRATLALSNGHTVSTTLAGIGQTQFIGFVSDDAVSSLTINTIQDAWIVLDVILASSPSTVPQPSQNYSDIWWNPNESGWGLTLADHGTQMFAVWYTYRQDGSSTWFVVPGGTFTQGKRLFSGDMYQTTGPPYSATFFDPGTVTTAKVGSIALDFSPPGLAQGNVLFTATVGSLSQTKQIQRQPFGSQAPNWGVDLTDMWWNPAESGWGVALAQHGSSVFGVWFTYDAQRRPIFFTLPGATFSDATTFSGDLYSTTGPYFGNARFDPAQVKPTKVGTATISFAAKAAGQMSGTFSPTVLGTPVPPKGILRETAIGALPGVCSVTLIPSASPKFTWTPPTIGTVSVVTAEGCPWEAGAESLTHFIDLLPPESGVGPGIIRYSVEQNELLSEKSGYVFIKNTAAFHVVTQQAHPVDTNCEVFFKPSTVPPVGPSAITQEVEVDAGGSCGTWTSTSDSTWLDIVPGVTGPGTKTMTYPVGSNEEA